MKRLFLLIMLLLAVFTTEAKWGKLGEGVDLYFLHASIYKGSEPRSESISAEITGKVLTISFNEDVGLASIMIKDSNGVYIDSDNICSTPDYAIFVIYEAGYYRMDVTLSNGDQCYGYFSVME